MTRWELLGGVGLDLALGDPRWLPHPVRGCGWLISQSEHLWRRSGVPLRLAGLLLCGSVVSISAAIVWATLPWANVYWIYSLLAIRALDEESTGVIRELALGNLNKARVKAAMIVGRDTADLDEPGVLRAAIETVSENVSDGVVAPLFYLGLFGPAGMAAYKAANTLDSMIGHKNDQYSELGWASARLDDLLNLIPSRLTAMLVWVAAGLLGLNLQRSLAVTLRDGGSQPSPNSGWPEAAFAGALGIQLGGTNYYGGIASRKAYLGDPIQPLSTQVFGNSRRLLYVSSLLMVAAVAVWT